MVEISAADCTSLKSWLPPEQAGSSVALHFSATGYGRCLVDRWPSPRIAVVSVGQRHLLAGDAAAGRPDDLRRQLNGVVEANPSFDRLIAEAFPAASAIQRVVLDGADADLVTRDRARVRRLGAADVGALEHLSPDLAWICASWNGPAGLASSNLAHGAFVDGRLVSVACPFVVGEEYEDLGVVTERDFRGCGLAGACASAVCDDIRARRRRPSWSAFADNLASLRVAEKLGFRRLFEQRLYSVGVWMTTMARARSDVDELIPEANQFILVDDCQWGSAFLPGRHAVPFLERDGEYYGVPANDSVAIAEMERLQRSGAAFLIVAAPAFWWLTSYAEFEGYLNSHFRCLLRNERVVVFDLRSSVASSPV